MKDFIRCRWGHSHWLRRFQAVNQSPTVMRKTRSPRWAWYCLPVSHQAICFRLGALGESPYSTNFKIQGDYELVSRLLKSGHSVAINDQVLSIFHHGGVSDFQSDLTREEENQVRLKYFDVPKMAGWLIMVFKRFNKKIAKFAWLRRLWRSRI